MNKWAALTHKLGIIISPIWNCPKKKHKLISAYGVWGINGFWNHRVLYANLITSGKLVAYLDDIEQQATAMFLRLVKELAEKENVTEELKATDQMLWVQKINNIHNRATEIVNAELIYTV